MAEDERFKFIVNRSSDLISMINADHTYEYGNAAYCAAMGIDPERIEGISVVDVLGEERYAANFKSVLLRCLGGETVEYIDVMSVGDIEKHLHITCSPHSTDHSTQPCALFVGHDITRLTEIETRLTRYEFIDPLTGLLNRRSLDVVLDREIYRAQRSRINVNHALAFISLQDFDQIHQSYGPEFADILLENTGVRVKQSVRETDYVFRFDGTVLTVLLTEITQAADAAIVAEKILDAVSMPYSFRNIETRLDCVIGISAYPDDANDSREMIRNANSAIVEAKKRHVPYLIYDPEIHERAIARVVLKSELQHAFEARQFVLHYQPFVKPDGTVAGAEALIRWNHPERGLLFPGSFIDVAEETRLISSIDKWALFEVCRELSTWQEFPRFFISINISARDLLDQYLVEATQQALAAAGGLEPRRLKLELTESISMDDPERSIDTMNRLMELGLDVWIDDFGTGQSSLSYLKNLPAVVLKIDRVFIDQIADNEDDREYLRSIVSAIRSRGKRVIIEGVSTPEQAEQLKGIRYEYLQGFFYSKGVPATELRRMVIEGVHLPVEEPVSD